jgi:hypothetical protein
MNKIFSNLIKSMLLIASFSQVANAELITFDWTAQCYDCNTQEIGVITGIEDQVTVNGQVILQDYTFGDALLDSNIVSFSYSGSLHIEPFTILNLNDGFDDIQNINGFINEDLSFDISFDFDKLFQYEIAVDSNGNPLIGEYSEEEFYSLFDHTEIVESAYNIAVDYDISGDWSYSVSGFGIPEQVYDFGTGATIALQSNGVTDVPEPSTLAIFALGMMGLASRKFKKNA